MTLTVPRSDNSNHQYHLFFMGPPAGRPLDGAQARGPLAGSLWLATRFVWKWGGHGSEAPNHLQRHEPKADLASQLWNLQNTWGEVIR